MALASKHLSTMRLFLSPTKLKKSTTEGVRVVACEIAMRTHKLRPSDMLQQVRYVQSGVAELIEKQTAGWSYIRP